MAPYKLVYHNMQMTKYIINHKECSSFGHKILKKLALCPLSVKNKQNITACIQAKSHASYTWNQIFVRIQNMKCNLEKRIVGMITWHIFVTPWASNSFWSGIVLLQMSKCPTRAHLLLTLLWPNVMVEGTWVQLQVVANCVATTDIAQGIVQALEQHLKRMHWRKSNLFIKKNSTWK